MSFLKLGIPLAGVIGIDGVDQLTQPNEGTVSLVLKLLLTVASIFLFNRKERKQKDLDNQVSELQNELNKKNQEINNLKTK